MQGPKLGSGADGQVLSCGGGHGRAHGPVFAASQLQHKDIVRIGMRLERLGLAAAEIVVHGGAAEEKAVKEILVV